MRSYIRAVMRGDSRKILGMNARDARGFALTAAGEARKELGGGYRILRLDAHGRGVTAFVLARRRFTTPGATGQLTLVRWTFHLIRSGESWQVAQEEWFVIGSCFTFPTGERPKHSLPCPQLPAPDRTSS